MTAQLLTIVDGTPRASSLQVAEHFNKRHDHVVRNIRQIIAQAPDYFNQPNFGAVEYVDSKGEKRPAYSLTRDGFTLLAMGFTGKEALQWKIKYIEAFNAMEAKLSGGFALHPDNAPDPEARSTVKDRKPLNALINTWVSLAPLSYRDAWQQVKAAFEVEGADGLTVSQLKPACAWVQSRIDATLAQPQASFPATALRETLYETKRRALENTKIISQIYRALSELDARSWDDYKTLDNAWMTLIG